MKKTNLVLDTNVLFNDTNLVERLLVEGFTVTIPLMVLEELDKFKGATNKNEELKFKARKVIRMFKKMEEEQMDIRFTSELIPDFRKVLAMYDFDDRYQDNKILMLSVLRETGTKLVTNDRAMLYKSKALGIDTNYLEGLTDVEKGKDVHEIKVKMDSMAQIRFRSEGWIIPEDVFMTDDEFTPNELVKLENENGGVEYARYTSKRRGNTRKFTGKIEKLIHFDTEFSHLKALNEEQQFLLTLLEDKDVTVVTVSGKAGTGKTLVALAYALETINRKQYSRLMLGKNTAPLDKFQYQGK